jgi:predicted permease
MLTYHQAFVGLYLHRRGFLKSEGTRTLALISQQVTIPLLFFTKIIYCNQDWSTDPCPDVTESLRDVWMLLWWPLYVVGMGLLVGYMAAKLSKTPPHQTRAVMAACGFGNSTGLPITLLTVVHANFPKTSDLGRIDPCLFLSVYLLLYPVLQWGIGGWLLAPQNTEENVELTHSSNPNDTTTTTIPGRAAITGMARNVLNQRESSFYRLRHRGMGEVDASLYMSVQESLDKYGRPMPPSSTDSSSDEESQDDILERYSVLPKAESFASIGMDLSKAGSFSNSQQLLSANMIPYEMERSITPADAVPKPINDECEASEPTPLLTSDTTPSKPITTPTPNNSNTQQQQQQQQNNMWGTLSKIAGRSLQPPVIAALLGILVASFPTLRGILVDIKDRDGDAPLQWMFDGLYEVGQAAVPINMMILGCNLSASYSASIKKSGLFSNATTMAIVIGKMIVLPIIGFASVIFFREYCWELPADIAGSFYLVVMIVFLTPTANNVMVMVELSGSGSKQGLSRIIAWQYAVAPILLSLSMTIAVGMADKWSS